MEKKLKLSTIEVDKYSEKILNTLSKYISWQEIDKLHIYLPIKEHNEVDTKKLIGFLRENYPNIQIEIAPKKAMPTIPEGNVYDLVILPVVGFDRRGYRLGYGGGYYDKFLAKNRCKQTIGLAYSFSEIDKIPDEPHDRKIQTIITEKEIINVV